MIRKSSLNELFVRRRGLTEGFSTIGSEPEERFADVTGFHAYGDLRLNLALSAAENGKSAKIYLQVLEEYAQVADVSAQNGGGQLLEVQGERLHFVFPAETVDRQSLSDFVTFCSEFTKLVYARVKPLAGTHWGGFAMAGDHGRAIIISTGRDGDDSAVSLGNPANAPAKRLAREPVVPSGRLAVPTQLVQTSQFVRNFAASGRGNWVEIDVLNLPTDIESAGERFRFSQVNESIATRDAARGEPRIVNFAAGGSLADGDLATIAQPISVQGICLRADLEGFSAQVQAAFAGNNEKAIIQLVQRFLVIMQYPDVFRQKVGRQVISLPWAGDCSTQLLLLRPGESYDELRLSTPVLAAMQWHEIRSGSDAEWQNLRLAVQGAKWGIGVACGNATEGSNGQILVANIQTSGRKYLIAGGWGIRRSLDAQQADNVKADDTVLHNVDYWDLHKPYRSAFVSLAGSTIFRRAPLSDLQGARGRMISGAASAPVVSIQSVTKGQVPQPRPHGGYRPAT